MDDKPAETAAPVVAASLAEPKLAFLHFERALKKTPNEVYTKLMRNAHGLEKHTITDWKRLLGNQAAAKVSR